jgi:hypothetical protein
MLCRPTVRLDVVHLARPLLSPRAVQPLIVFAPSLNLITPDGASPVTRAVNVTDWPTFDGLWEELRRVVLCACTVCVRTPEALPALCESPL